MLPGCVYIALQLVPAVVDALPHMQRVHWPCIVCSPASPNSKVYNSFKATNFEEIKSMDITAFSLTYE
jgi:hypothetical protein